MINWFEIWNDRLTAIEKGQRELCELLKAPSNTTAPDKEPYGDFKWLVATCSGVPASTLRVKSANGEIPGLVKFGKRVLYDKAAVLNWLRSRTVLPLPDATQMASRAEDQISRQLGKRKGGATL